MRTTGTLVPVLRSRHRSSNGSSVSGGGSHDFAAWVMADSTWIFVADVGGPATYHVGDEAMLDANLGLFASLLPGLKATVVSKDPAHTALIYNVDAVPTLGFSSWDPAEHEAHAADLIANSRRGDAPAAVKAVLSADGLVISGGGNLSTSWPHHIYERVVLARVARDHGIPVIVLGQTIGPNLADGHRERVSEMLSRAAWVGVRDATSYALARQLGVAPGNLSYQRDDAIDMPGDVAKRPWAYALGRQDMKPWIAVTIHPIDNPAAGGAWLDDLARELEHIAELTGARLVFIPHVAAVDTQTAGDRAVGEALARRMNPDRALQVGGVLTARETRWLTGQADLVISTRYHPVVFGLASGVPSLALWTSQYTRVKLEGALIHAGRVEDGCDLFALGVGELADRALALWSARDHVRADIVARAVRWREDEGRRRVALGAMVRGPGRASTPHADEPDPTRVLANLAQALHGSICYAEHIDSRAHRELGEAEQRLASFEAARDAAVDYATTLEMARDQAVGYAATVEAARDQAAGYAATVEAARDQAAGYAATVEAERDEAMGYAATVEAARDEAMGYAATVEAARDRAAGYAATVEAERDEAMGYAATLEAARNEAVGYAAALQISRDEAAGYARSQARDAEKLRHSLAEVERYAASLVTELDQTRTSAQSQIAARDARFLEVERYAKSLLLELEGLREREAARAASENNGMPMQVGVRRH